MLQAISTTCRYSRKFFSSQKTLSLNQIHEFAVESLLAAFVVLGFSFDWCLVESLFSEVKLCLMVVEGYYIELFTISLK